MINLTIWLRLIVFALEQKVSNVGIAWIPVSRENIFFDTTQEDLTIIKADIPVEEQSTEINKNKPPEGLYT